MTDVYPVEILDPEYDDGTMPENVEQLREHVVGHRIVSAEQSVIKGLYWGTQQALILTLDNGKRVALADTEDCCAFTALEYFFLEPDSVEHVITGVGTTDGYSTWHIYANMGDVMRLGVGWSSGNPFYYGYGFDIRVVEV